MSSCLRQVPPPRQPSHLGGSCSSGDDDDDEDDNDAVTCVASRIHFLRSSDGARFAKWRNVLQLDPEKGLPSDLAIADTVHTLARYASIQLPAASPATAPAQHFGRRLFE